MRARDVHALWIGALTLGLAIWFDVVWIGILVVVLIGIVVLSIDWVIRVLNPPRRWGDD